MRGRQFLAKSWAASDHGPIPARTAPRCAWWFIDAGDRTMDGTEGRRRGFVAEVQRFFDCFNQFEAATGSIFILLLLMGPRQGLGSSLTAVGGFGSLAVIIVAIVRWIRGRNESPPPTAEDR